jgi:tetratricopeptide (TPR) repeat protein
MSEQEELEQIPPDPIEPPSVEEPEQGASQEGDDHAEVADAEAPAGLSGGDEPSSAGFDEDEPIPDEPVDFGAIRAKCAPRIAAGQHAEVYGLLEQLARWPDNTRQLDDSLWLYTALGDAARALGKPDVALKAYAQGYAIDPRALPILKPYAEVLFEQGQAERALEVLRAVLLYHKRILTPQDLVAIYHRMGTSYEALKQYDKARSSFEKALEHSPQEPAVLAGLLRISSLNAAPEEVLKIRQRMVRSIDNNRARSMALVAMGDDYVERFNDPGRALDTYEEALVEDPKNRRALERIGEVARLIQDWRRVSRAYFTLSRLAETPAEEADWLIRASQIARDELWEPEKALVGFRRAVELDPSRLDAFKTVASLLVDAKDWEGLESAYLGLLTATKAMPNPNVNVMVVLWQNLGELYRTQLNRPHDAIIAYDQASQLLPQSIDIHEMVAQLAEKEADHQELALVHLQAIRVLDPSRHDALERIGRVFLRQKQIDRAYCVFRALPALNHPLEDRARQFVERFQRPTFRAPNAPLAAELMRRHIYSDKLDRRLGEVFALLKPGLEEWTGEDKAKYDLKRKDRVEIEQDLVFNKIYRSIGALLGYRELPEIWRKPQQPGLINGALIPEGLIAGDALLGSGREKHIAFTCAKQLFLFMPAFYLAAIRPQSDLQGFFRLGLALTLPGYDFPKDPNSQAVFKMVQKKVQGQQLERLKTLLQGLSSQEGGVDIGLFVEAVEDSANRVGFLFCDDLQAAAECLRDEPQRISARPVSERMRTLIEWTLTDDYAALRAQLGLAVG